MTGSDTTAPVEPAPNAFTEQQVVDALNAAAEDILDGINLMVNATVAYLRGGAADLHDVAEGSYGEDLDTVLGWIGEAA